MKWTRTIAVAALLGASAAWADDAHQSADAAVRDALLQHATLPSGPPVLPDRMTSSPLPARGLPMPGAKPRDERRGPEAPRSPKGTHDAASAVAGVSARHDGDARRATVHDESRTRAAQARVMVHGARDADAMRAEAANRAAMRYGVGGIPGMMGQQGSWSSEGSGGCQDGAEMWRTMNPGGGMMSTGGTGSGGTSHGGMGGMSGGGWMFGGTSLTDPAAPGAVSAGAARR